MERSHGLGALVAAAITVLSACVQDADPTILFASAGKRLAAGEYSAATIELRNALERAPNAPEGRLLLARALLGLGQVAGAEVELRRAAQLGASPDQAAPLLATVLIAQRKYRDVIDEFGTVRLDDQGADSRLSLAVAQAYARTGDGALGERVIDGLLARQPTNRDARRERARLLATRGQDETARAIADELVSSGPDDAQAWLLKADLMRAAGAPPLEVTRAYEESIRREPRLLPAQMALVTLALQRKDRDAAKARWGEMQRQFPDHPQVLFVEASLALMDGEPMRTREVTQRLLKGAPGNPRLLALAAQAETALGARETAIGLLQRAVREEPQHDMPRRLLASLHLQSGDAAAALSVLRPGMHGDAPAQGLLLLAAQAHLLQGDFKAADATFDRAVKLDPADHRTRVARAMSRLARGQDDWAFAELRSSAAADQSSTLADMALISGRFARGEIDAALGAIAGLDAKLPNSPLPDHLRGQAALLRKDPARARQFFERALNKDATHYASIAQLAALDAEAGELDAARKRLEAVIAREPSNVWAMVAIAELLSTRPWVRNDVNAWLEKASAARPNDRSLALAIVDVYLHSGQLARGRTAIDSLLAAKPDAPDALDRLGRIQLAAGEAEKALETFTKLQAAEPRSAQTQFRLAQAHRAQKDWPAASRHVQRALELSPGLLAARRAQAEIALSQLGPVRGMGAVRSLQKDFSAEAAGWLLEGDAAMARGQWDAAARAYRTAMGKTRPADASIRLYRALNAAGRPAEAEAHAATWLQSHPGDRTFRLARADVALQRKEWDVAESRYREVIAVDADDAAALNNLAVVLMARDKRGALELAQRAVQLLPERAAYLNTLARALAAEKRLDEAIQWQNKAVELRPADGSMVLDLARLQIEVGRTGEARQRLLTLQRMGSAFPQQKEVAALLGRIGG
jgi:putative PEP-CTERM system TPR-repeat lipoprotein